MPEEAKKLQRSRSDKILFGVCGGLARHFNIDATLVRVIFILLAISNSLGTILYLALAVIVPKEPGEDIHIDRREKIRDFAHEVGQKTKEMAHEVNANDWFQDSRNIFGLVVILIGIMLLANQVFPYRFWPDWNILWPAIIILIGLFIVAKHNKKHGRR